MVAFIIATAIVAYIVSVVIMCRNAAPYDPEWEEPFELPADDVYREE